MSKRPEEVIRRYLDEHGEMDECPLDHLLVTWRLDEPTPESRAMITRSLESVGVRVEPPLRQVPVGGEVSLRLQARPRAIRDFDVARVLVGAGAVIALVSLWLPWVGWTEPIFPFDGQADAWAALGLEPWLILVAALVGAGTLLPADFIPEGLRDPSPSRLTWAALLLGVLAAGIATAYSFAPASTERYGSEVGLGPIVALWASCLMVVGIWLSRERVS